MTHFGYKLMTETHGPRDLVENAVAAERAGFDFVSISDHFHPWLQSHGHSPFAWSVLGAIAHATKTVGICTGLTCPIIRYHPAIVAQAAATIGVMSEGRFTLALGTGERLNEHVVGQGWPGPTDRLDMLREAVEIMRLLWEGDLVSHSGTYFDVESARIYDLPQEPIPIVIGAGGPKAAALAGEIGDGMMTVSADSQLVEAFRNAGGGTQRLYAELACAYAESKQEALELAHRYSRFGALDWSVLTEIPGVAGFEAATRFVRPEDLAQEMPHGPDVDTYVDAIEKFVDAGFDHIVLVGVGEDQHPFLRFFEEELSPRLRSGKAARADAHAAGSEPRQERPGLRS
ncbi:MAG TPA: TIGR03557 family F420-dependent LLM class oxidoreductase [Candidatus Limnocylindrales bacterium]|nr:TIGR03557 family F420-dependent LLM class oxidoreductase [Candidatus Limnocylindrales bacterium]